MSRMVSRKLTQSKGKEKIIEYGYLGTGDRVMSLDNDREIDWTELPDDTVVQLFFSLNYRDRASLASTCRAWRALGSSTPLWNSLDLRGYKCDAAMATSLASRCSKLQKLWFRGVETANAMIHLRARRLHEIIGVSCGHITDATLSMVAARHEELESLQLGPDSCERISSDGIKIVALCCPNLKKLWLSGVPDIDGDAVNALAENCGQLMEIGFMDCLNVNVLALGNLDQIRFLSIAGIGNVRWTSAARVWCNLPNLIGLDVSRTGISPNAVSTLLSSSQSLRVLSALHCFRLEAEANRMAHDYGGKLLLTISSDIFKELASLFPDVTSNYRKVFSYWRKLKYIDKKLNAIMCWLERIVSHSLQRIVEDIPLGYDDFWLSQGAALFLNLVQSLQENVQESAAAGLASLIAIYEDNFPVHRRRTEVVMQDGGICLLLDVAKSCRESLQPEAAKAIRNLSVDARVAKAIAEGGGINILADLARSTNRVVAEEAAGGILNLSLIDEHKDAIAEAGGVEVLVDLISKWLTSSEDGVLECAAGALANLAADDKCSMEVARAGGIHALVMLAQSSEFEGVQEQAARALANLAAHGDGNRSNAALGQEVGAIEALMQLILSPNDGVRQEAAGALCNLSFHDQNRDAIAAAGGVQALVTLVHDCTNADVPQGLQERAAGALWGLSLSKANSIAIGRQGGVPPLIELARSNVEDVHATAAGALWKLAFNVDSALHIVEEGGVPVLIHLCSSSGSKMARFMAALALTYIFDGRLEIALTELREGVTKIILLNRARRMALIHIERFVLTFCNLASVNMAVASSAHAALFQVAEAACIQEAGNLRCSEAEIGRYVAMLQNSCSILKVCAAFALLQFTAPGGKHAMHHSTLLEKAGAERILRFAAEPAAAPIELKICARIVLRNLVLHDLEAYS